MLGTFKSLKCRGSTVGVSECRARVQWPLYHIPNYSFLRVVLSLLCDSFDGVRKVG